MAVISLDEVKELLPQRYPFLLIDRVVDLDLDKNSIRCYKNVSNNLARVSTQVWFKTLSKFP